MTADDRRLDELAALATRGIVPDDLDDLARRRQESDVALADRLREAPPLVADDEPPADLWAGIEAALADEPVAAAVVSDPAPAPAPASAGPRVPDAAPDATVVPLHPRRKLGLGLTAAAAVCAVVVLGFVVAGRGTGEAELIGEARLDLLDTPASGSARFVDDDGDFRLELDVAMVDAPDGEYAEVWLIDPDVTQLISLGPLRSDGRYPVPAGVDPTAFPIVDVSYETLDGDPSHGGNSVLRGQLSFDV